MLYFIDQYDDISTNKICSTTHHWLALNVNLKFIAELIYARKFRSIIFMFSLPAKTFLLNCHASVAMVMLRES